MLINHQNISLGSVIKGPGRRFRVVCCILVLPSNVCEENEKVAFKKRINICWPIRTVVPYAVY